MLCSSSKFFLFFISCIFFWRQFIMISLFVSRWFLKQRFHHWYFILKFSSENCLSCLEEISLREFCTLYSFIFIHQLGKMCRRKIFYFSVTFIDYFGRNKCEILAHGLLLVVEKLYHTIEMWIISFIQRKIWMVESHVNIWLQN